MTEITKSPLCWPQHFPRTKSGDRTHGRFGKKGSQGYGIQDLTLREATNRVLKALWSFTRSGRDYRCRADEAIISTNLDLRNDGLPRSVQKKPSDSGVAVYFELDRKQRCIPCDMYLRIEDNLAAIAATIDALRTMERHGSQMFEAAFSGFDALPGPDHFVGRNWRDVLDCYSENLRDGEDAYKRLRKLAHPDHGGTTEKFNEVQTAWEQAQEELVR